MTRVHIFVIAIFPAILVTGCVEIEQDWAWDLTQGQNTVEFTQEQLNCCDSDNPVDVLASIDPYWTYIFENETWSNYWYNQPDPRYNGGTLQHIQPGVTYYIVVTQDCTLAISG